MQADIEQGICERRDCDEPYAYRLTWIGGAPAYVCAKHMRSRRDSEPLVEAVTNRTTKEDSHDG